MYFCLGTTVLQQPLKAAYCTTEVKTRWMEKKEWREIRDILWKASTG
jgi:hypothetical protein